MFHVTKRGVAVRALDCAERGESDCPMGWYGSGAEVAGREGGAEVPALEGVRGVGERREELLEPEEGVVAERLLGVGILRVLLSVGSTSAGASLSKSPSSLPLG